MNCSAASTLRDFIMVIDDALPTEFSKRVLGEYENCSLWNPGDVETGRSGKGVRNCHIIDITHPDSVDDRAERNELLIDLTALAKGWATAYQEAIVPIGIPGRTGIVLARYGRGGYYRSHTDSHANEVRTLSLIAVADTEFTGGELSFFRGEHVLDLKPGQVCLFPSNFQYPHAVKPVQSGTRYSLISWLR